MKKNEPPKTPGEAVQQLARDKAESVAQDLWLNAKKETLVIGSDTIVVFENRILGKPKDRRGCRRNAGESCRDNTHQVYTGVTVLERKAGTMGGTYFLMRVRMWTFYPVSRE